MEDLNFLYFRQQTALKAVGTAQTAYDRRAHERLARAYGVKIARFRAAL